MAVIAPDDVWAVGLGDNPALAEHWDGKRWTWVAPPGSDVSLWAVDGDTTNDVWAVGTDDSGLVVIRWDGSAWRRMPAPSAPASVTNGPLTTFSGLTGVAVLAKNDVWVAGSKATGGFRGDALTAHWDGRRWQFVTVPAAVNDLGTFAVVSPRDIWAVTGQRGRGDVIHWDGVRWRISPHPEMDGPVSDVSAGSQDGVWVVNPVMHWNGRRWSVIRRPPSFDWYLAVVAVSQQDVWVTREARGRDFTDKPVFEHYSCNRP